ncbi:DNA repair protein RecN [Flavobacteriaceae bacterium]|nr:DNA repair protein RecN [Flavobacteriaceae bacterium]
MIRRIYIKNYALIQELELEFPKGFVVITGETGSGKSILLGALQLALGARADHSILFNKEDKCVLEVELEVSDNYRQWFKDNDFDYEPTTIIRRELSPNGKSRLFVNDSPVTQNLLKQLTDQLIVIHSQHESHGILASSEQINLLDEFSGSTELSQLFKEKYKEYRSTQKIYGQLLSQKEAIEKEWDYHQFLIEELEAAKVHFVDLDALETEFNTLSEIDTIRLQLSQALGTLQDEQMGVLTTLNQLQRTLSDLSRRNQQFKSLEERVISVLLELRDIDGEIENSLERLVPDPSRLEELDARINDLYRLQQKHKAASISELKEIYQDLNQKLSEEQSPTNQIASIETQLDTLKSELDSLVIEIQRLRQKGADDLSSELEAVLHKLGMPSSEVRFDFKPSELTANGGFEIDLMFKANRGGVFSILKNSISGGELSRLALAIEYVRSRKGTLPVQVFDEIDTGVSGEIADKMAQFFVTMGTKNQLIVISHLPQVASKGTTHFKIAKTEDSEFTRTQMLKLSNEEREIEIATMIEGLNPSDTAIQHARSLLARL